MTTARAQVLTAARSLELREFPVCDISDQDGLLDVNACGLCGSDIASFTGTKDHGGEVILGHEVIGRIAQLGPAAQRLWGVAVGDRIAIEEAVPCMSCDLCRNGQHRICTRSGVRYGDSTVDIAPALWGGFAEQMYLHPGTQVHRVPDSIPDDVATLFIPLSNGLSWINDSGELRPGDTLVVIGAGQHAVASALAGLRMGAGTVLLVGTPGDARRLDLAKSFGCRTLAIDPSESATAAILDTLGGTADVVVDMTPGATRPLVSSIEVAGIGARVLWGGLKRGSGRAEIPVDDIIRKELRVRGLWARASWAITAAFDWLSTAPELAKLCQATYRMADLPDAFAAAENPDPAARPLHIAIVNSESPAP